MIIGGISKFSLIDFPGKVAAVIFTLGCNFRCPFCHNPELVLPEQYAAPLDEYDVWQFLEKRAQQLDGLVITGGEPTLHSDLEEFCRRAKELGYAVKLDTNGTSPKMLKSLLAAELLDYVAMDIKAQLPRYPELTGVDVDIRAIQTSIGIIKSSGIRHQFRTTVVRPFLDAHDLSLIQAGLGHVEKLHIQPCLVSGKILQPELAEWPQYSVDELTKLEELISISTN